MFADRIESTRTRTGSILVAGFDPVFEQFPKFILDEACRAGKGDEESIYQALSSLYQIALETLHAHIAAIKPNLGFFEQYGLGGMRAFDTVCKLARDLKVPVIADGKRGDIGSTAQAYSAAYLGRSRVFGKATGFFDVDALTVSPFLGFDTLEPFIKDCEGFGKGIFVLVKTSNPGSAATQQGLSERIATWLAEQAARLVSPSGLSGLGAVVGATYPEEARALRKLMPSNLFLVPGLGAQGGSADDALAGAMPGGRGVLVNVSRGLFLFDTPPETKAELAQGLLERVQRFNAELAAARNTPA